MQKTTIVVFGLFHAFFAYAGTGEKLDHYLSLSLEELMDLKVTISTDTKQTLSQAPAAVTVITQEDIKATGATNLVEVLEAVPGLHIRYSQFAFRPLIEFRGASDKQTLLMINGAPMRDLMWSFGIFWKGLPISMIERVEIIRGPGSALFGSDASAGVINVITKTACKLEESELGVRSGSFDTQNAWMQYAKDWNGVELAMTADFFTTNGHDPFIGADGQTQQDQTLDSDVSLAPGRARYGWQNTDLRFSLKKGHWELRGDYAHHSELEIGLTGAGVLDPLTLAEDTYYDVELLYINDNFSEDWGLDAELRYHHLKYSSGDGFQEYPPGAFDGDYPDGVINQMRSAERRLVFETSGLYRGVEDHAIRLGAGHTWQDLYYVEQLINRGIGPDGDPLPPGGALVDVSDTPYAFAPEKLRKIRHLFLQDVWRLTNDLELTAGARYDHYSDFGDSVNPRLVLVWQTSDQLTSKLMYGQAFRAPNYQELFAETSFTLPNPSLNPERSETWEISFAYKVTKDLYFGLNLYRFHLTDMILPQSVPDLPKLQYQNTGEQIIHGLELEARWQPTDDLRLSGNYTYRDPDESELTTNVSPNREAYLRADWRLHPDWNWNLQSNWVGERARISAGDMRPPVDDYWITDTTLRYKGLKQWEFAASVRNLFDQQAYEYTRSSIPNDLPLPGRNLYLEIRYLF